MNRALLVLCLVLFVPVPARAQENPLGWVNGLRQGAGAHAVAEDALLSETARRWAETLAAAGALSHRGADGSSALDRYRALGGTEARVGEIIGAGAGLKDVEKAWERSEPHRSLSLKAYWTHAGWGRASGSPGVQVWVVVFCERLIEGLDFREAGEALEIAGRLLPAEAREPVLLSGIDRIAPAAWDPGSRGFLFRLPLSAVAGYLRIGFLAAEGRLVVTNALTWPRGKGSPGAPGRPSAPRASP